MPVLESKRLCIRPFRDTDLEVIHRILNDGFGQDKQMTAVDALQERRSWLHWQIASYEWLAKLHQPPYGDRAIVLKHSDELIGSVGFVPLYNAFGQIPELRGERAVETFNWAEVGLFWVVDSRHRCQGYACEAGQALMDYAFSQLNLCRILACTTYENLPSQGVMRRLGMALLHNPLPDPPWLQVVGLLENADTNPS